MPITDFQKDALDRLRARPKFAGLSTEQKRDAARRLLADLQAPPPEVSQEEPRAEVSNTPPQSLGTWLGRNVVDPTVQAATDVAHGINVGGYGLMRSVGIPGVTDADVEAAEARRQAQAEEYDATHEVDRFGHTIRAGQRLGLQVAAGAALPGPLGKTPITRMLGAPLTGAVAGAGGAVVAGGRGEELIAPMILGAVTNTLFQGGAELIPTFKSTMIKRMINKAQADADSTDVRSAFAAVAARPSLSEKLGDPNLQREELALSTREPRPFLEARARQREALTTTVRERAQELGPGIPPTAQGRGLIVESAVRSKVDRLYNNLSEGWTTTTAPLAAHVGNRRMTLDSTIVKLDELIERYDTPEVPGTNIGNHLRSWKRKLQSPATGAGPAGYTLDQVTDMLAGLSAKLRKNDPRAAHSVFHRIGDQSTERVVSRELINTLLDDVDSLATQLDPVLGGVMRKARTDYRVGMDEVRKVQATDLAKFVDKRSTAGVIGAEAAYTKFKSLRPSEMAQAIKLMDEYSPMLVGRLKAGVLEDALNAAAVKEGAFAVGNQAGKRFNVQVFLKESRHPAFERLGLNKGKLAAALKVMDRIEANTPALSARDIAEELGAKAGTATGLAMGNVSSLLFAAKYWIKYGGLKDVARVMADPDGPEALKILEGALGPKAVAVGKTAPKVAWAVGVLMGNASDEPL